MPDIQSIRLAGLINSFCMGPVLLEDGRVMMAGGSVGQYGAWDLPGGLRGLQVRRA